MDTFIKENYNIIETYEKNQYNEIQMGTKINDTESIVVVNTINKIDAFEGDLKNHLENSLQNLLYITENENSITFVTEYHEGITLKDYLQSMDISKNTRIEIAKKYLNYCLKYNSLNDTFKRILVDHKQINIDKGELYLNELIMLSNFKETQFTEVTKEIGKVLHLLLEEDEFIETLLNGSFFYHSVDEITNIFNTHYNTDETHYFDNVDNEDATLIPMPIDSALKTENEEIIEEELPINTENDSEIELSSLGFIDDKELDDDIKDKKEKNKFLIPAIIIFFLLVGGYFLKNISLNNTSSEKEFAISFYKEKIGENFKFTANTKDNTTYNYEWKFFSKGEELASFGEKSIIIGFKNEGTYLITLRVQDEKGNWSDTYSEEFYYAVNEMNPLDENPEQSTSVSEKLENFTISYESDNIIDDYENKKSGNKSLKFDFTGNNKNGEIALKDILMKNDVSVSLFIKSDSRNPINLTFTGMNGNTEQFAKTITHIPSLENTWEMISFNLNTSNVENLIISIQTNDSTIWIDDIVIDSYK
ncbi:hypothetical protein QUF55_03060 [Clostridiaceae bacterium HSG29]|nr:hypothetical protein [Clostridiaceae bacterium HSG29]